MPFEMVAKRRCAGDSRSGKFESRQEGLYKQVSLCRRLYKDSCSVVSNAYMSKIILKTTINLQCDHPSYVPSSMLLGRFLAFCFDSCAIHRQSKTCCKDHRSFGFNRSTL